MTISQSSLEQGTGFVVPSPFTQFDLARWQCGSKGFGKQADVLGGVDFHPFVKY